MHGIPPVHGRKYRRYVLTALVSQLSFFNPLTPICCFDTGTITLKKCLKGDGQICIDSDENIIKQAKAYAETKKNATVRKVGLKMRNSNTGGATAGLNPDPNFIGVTLTSSGIPQREYLNEN